MSLTLTDQLEAARALLGSLEAGAARLQANLDQQQAELEQLQRAARADDGTASFDDVVSQQARRDAARGLLDQQHQDLAHQLALVEELEQAQQVDQQQAEGRQLWATYAQLGSEYHARAAALEEHIARELEALQATAAAHAEAGAGLVALMLDHAAHLAGMTPAEARQQVRQTSYQRTVWPTVEVTQEMADGQTVTSLQRGKPERQPVPRDQLPAAGAALLTVADTLGSPQGAAALLDLARATLAGDAPRLSPADQRHVLKLLG